MLGAVLLDEQHLHALLVDEQLRPEHFYVREHSAVFEAMLELYEADKKIDHLTVAEQLRQNSRLEEIGGADVVEELVAWVPSTGHARDYGRIVREQAQMRALLEATRGIEADVLARNAIATRTRRAGRAGDAGGRHMTSGRRQSARSQRSCMRRPTVSTTARIKISPLTGTPSGFRDLDDMSGGFQAGNLIVLAARPSMGKSALVCKMAENAALAGFRLRCSRSRCRSPSFSRSASSPRRRRFLATTCVAAGSPSRAGRRSSRPLAGCRTLPSISMTQAIPGSWRSAPSPGACITSSRIAVASA